MQAFHLSLPCHDIEETCRFYLNVLGCDAGRRSANWSDVDFFGSQLTFVESSSVEYEQKRYSFNGESLPLFHFGALLEEPLWRSTLDACTERGLELQGPIEFLMPEAGTHLSFFVKDPNGYTIEFKCFHNPKEVFL